MTAEEFQQLWLALAPAAPPISYLLKTTLPERWFRIHSLPQSKRYPKTATEWTLLLERQLTILADILTNAATTCLVTGYYTLGNEPDTAHFLRENEIFAGIHFTPLQGIKNERFS